MTNGEWCTGDNDNSTPNTADPWSTNENNETESQDGADQFSNFSDPHNEDSNNNNDDEPASAHQTTVFQGPPQDFEAAQQKARMHEWVAPTKYDYQQLGTENWKTDETHVPHEWLAAGAKYEWSDEYGEIGPRDPKLEEILFTDERYVRPGDGLENFDFKVQLEGTEKPDPVWDFSDMGLHPQMMENITRCGYQHPTLIQSYAIPSVLMGRDVVACAHTGSGKTASYLCPILSKLFGKAKKLCAPKPNPATYNYATDRVRAEPLVLIICPTRELSAQIYDECRRLSYRTMLRPCSVYGGGPIRSQIEDLVRGCDILVGTPGRLLNLMSEPHVLSLRRVKFTVIDEADEMLKDDWDQGMKTLLTGGDNNTDDDHVFMMFSATFPKNARRLARKYMAGDYIRIRVGRAGMTHKNIRQQIVWVDHDRKKEALYDMLFTMPPARTIVFVNSKRMADLLDDYLFNLCLPSTALHSDKTQLEREHALIQFREGVSPILIATAITARGIDIRNVMHVINYDLPMGSQGGCEEYVHRIGRTARIGNLGLATSFYNERNEDIAEGLVKILRECDQPIPDFLEQFSTEGEIIFEDEATGSEDENDDENPESDEEGEPGSETANGNDDGSANDDAFGDAANGEKPDADKEHTADEDLKDGWF